MQQINWFRRIVFSVALWVFALGFGTAVANTLKRALSPDESYRLDCRWVPRSEPLNTFDDPVSRVWGQYYSASAAGILLAMWAYWETLNPRRRRGNKDLEPPRQEPQADGWQIGEVQVCPGGHPAGGGRHP